MYNYMRLIFTAFLQSPKSPGPFRVVGQIMDHLYEVMSNKSPGLVSGASVSPMATQNEYTMVSSLLEIRGVVVVADSGLKVVCAICLCHLRHVFFIT